MKLSENQSACRRVANPTPRKLFLYLSVLAVSFTPEVLEATVELYGSCLPKPFKFKYGMLWRSVTCLTELLDSLCQAKAHKEKNEASHQGILPWPRVRLSQKTVLHAPCLTLHFFTSPLPLISFYSSPPQFFRVLPDDLIFMEYQIRHGGIKKKKEKKTMMKISRVFDRNLIKMLSNLFRHREYS